MKSENAYSSLEREIKFTTAYIYINIYLYYMKVKVNNNIKKFILNYKCFLNYNTKTYI